MVIGHEQAGGPRPKVFVVGDLNVDHVVADVPIGTAQRIAIPPPAVGGSAYNAAVAFKDAGFQPLVFGKVGDDVNGDLIIDELDRRDIDHRITRHSARPTCACTIIYFQGTDDRRTIFYGAVNANDYDVRELRGTLQSAGLGPTDLIFSPLHIFEQTDGDMQHCQQFFGELRSSGVRLVVDIVPHSLYERLDAAAFEAMVGTPPFVLISECQTLARMMGWPRAETFDLASTPSQAFYDQVVRTFSSQYYVCRFGVGGISHEAVLVRSGSHAELCWPVRATGYETIDHQRRRGFGDALTAATLTDLVGLPSATSGRPREHV